MELAIRFDPETQQFQLVSDGNVLGGVEKEDWSKWVVDVENIGVQPTVDNGQVDEVESSTDEAVEGTEESKSTE